MYSQLFDFPQFFFILRREAVGCVWLSTHSQFVSQVLRTSSEDILRPRKLTILYYRECTPFFSQIFIKGFLHVNEKNLVRIVYHLNPRSQQNETRFSRYFRCPFFSRTFPPIARNFGTILTSNQPYFDLNYIS